MSSNRREFIAGTGAALAALSGLAACAKRSPEVKAVDIDALLSGIGGIAKAGGGRGHGGSSGDGGHSIH